MRKEIFLKSGSTFHADPSQVTKEVKKTGWLRSIIYKLLSQAGVPVYDPCCDTGERVVVVYNRTTGKDEIFLNGQWVVIEEANGASTTTSTTTTLP